MKQLHTEILIRATPAKIWQELMDFEHFPDWNPFIRSIAGERTQGAALQVRLQPPGMSGMTINPNVMRVIPEKEFRWKGKLLFGGIFDGEHYFLLEDAGNGMTRFVHAEKFSGILIPFMGGVLKKTKEGFEAMNEALKERCE